MKLAVAASTTLCGLVEIC